MDERRSPERSRHLLLNDTKDVVSHCRDFTRQALAAWGWPVPPQDDGGPAEAAEAEDVLLLVSEVVANARLHGGGPRTLQLHRTPDGLRIEVTDHSPTPPILKPWPDPAQPGGHGLVIVQRLARRWGSEPMGDGKCVWLEVLAPRRPGPKARGPRGERSE
ncbi:ATP-binding protein [Streptomyces sp. RerS4]|uniref:ATP-binding protein n=1 Tax=Streptomyces sp. RerS4 TaxID=2942449 RepID=UPI00201BC390|nr:ATP-binding protein [Streptomyces sp. RerS4]UQX00028.1 ATP-binding protein [Streptomyces sp. RerS4]